jgi:hypothetical protein
MPPYNSIVLDICIVLVRFLLTVFPEVYLWHRARFRLHILFVLQSDPLNSAIVAAWMWWVAICVQRLETIPSSRNAFCTEEYWAYSEAFEKLDIEMVYITIWTVSIYLVSFIGL